MSSKMSGPVDPYIRPTETISGVEPTERVKEQIGWPSDTLIAGKGGKGEAQYPADISHPTLLPVGIEREVSPWEKIYAESKANWINLDRQVPVEASSEQVMQQRIDLAAEQLLETHNLNEGLYYYPELASKIEKKQLESIAKSAQQEVESEYGPQEGSLKPRTADFDAMVGAKYSYLNLQALRSLPREKQVLTDAVRQASLARVHEEFALPSDWKPTGPELWTSSTQALEPVKYTESMEAILLKLQEGLPDKSMASTSMADTLYVVSVTILALTKILYATEVVYAELGEELNRVRADTNMAKVNAYKESLAKQEAERKEQEDKGKGKKIFNKIMEVFAPVLMAISIAATVCSLGAMAPVTMALTVTLAALTTAEMASGKSLIGAAINHIAKYVLAPLIVLIVKDENVANMIATAIVIAAIIYLSKRGGMDNIKAAMIGTQMIGSSNVVTDSLVNVFHVDQSKAAMIGLGITIAMTVIVIVAACRVKPDQLKATYEARATEFATELESAQKMKDVMKIKVAEVKIAINGFQQKLSENLAGPLTRVLILAEIPMGLQKVFNGVLSKSTYDLKALLAILEAEMQGLEALLSEIIKMQGESIQKLLELLTSVAEEIGQKNSFLSTMYKDYQRALQG